LNRPPPRRNGKRLGSITLLEVDILPAKLRKSIKAPSETAVVTARLIDRLIGEIGQLLKGLKMEIRF